MKRLYQTQRQKLRQQRRQQKRERRRKQQREIKEKKRIDIEEEGFTIPDIRRMNQERQDSQHAFIVQAPPRCSFAQHPEEFLEFLHKLEQHFKHGRKVKIDFRATTFVTCDAFTVLLSKLHDKRFCPHLGSVWLRRPHKNSPIRSTWDNSGMAKQFLVQPQSLERIEQLGNIINMFNKDVIAEQTSEMIEWAMEKLYGKKQYCPPVQTVFVELMDNTTIHASLQADLKEMWWTSVYFDKERQTLCYTFTVVLTVFSR